MMKWVWTTLVAIVGALVLFLLLHSQKIRSAALIKMKNSLLVAHQEFSKGKAFTNSTISSVHVRLSTNVVQLGPDTYWIFAEAECPWTPPGTILGMTTNQVFILLAPGKPRVFPRGYRPPLFSNGL